MEEAGKNGTSNAIVVHRKPGIKKRTGLQAIWAAILLQFKFGVSKKPTLARPKLDKKEDLIESPTKSETTWKDIVGGIRPLHMMQQLEYRSLAFLPPPPPPPPHFDKETYHDVSLPPSSPAHSCDGINSRYCSAEDLRALDKEGAVDEEGSSDVINTQADEFIAKFYEQIRLQRLQSLNEA